MLTLGIAARLAVAAAMVSAAAGQQITVYSSDSVAIGQTRQLTAYVPLVVNTVTWSVNGMTGGSTTYGTVSAMGLYTAPAVVPAAPKSQQYCSLLDIRFEVNLNSIRRDRVRCRTEAVEAAAYSGICSRLWIGSSVPRPVHWYSFP